MPNMAELGSEPRRLLSEESEVILTFLLPRMHLILVLALCDIYHF